MKEDELKELSMNFERLSKSNKKNSDSKIIVLELET